MGRIEPFENLRARYQMGGSRLKQAWSVEFNDLLSIEEFKVAYMLLHMQLA